MLPGGLIWPWLFISILGMKHDIWHFFCSSGMMHLMDHDKVNEYLGSLMATEGLDVQLSYDGLRIPVSL